MNTENTEQSKTEVVVDNQQLANMILSFLRKVSATADEHDGLRAGVILLHDKAKLADALQTKCKDLETSLVASEEKIKELEAKLLPAE